MLCRKLLAVILLTNMLPLPAQADSEAPEKTLSPYFFVKSSDAAVDQLPLKATEANVNISGVIADVTVRQVYQNNGTTPLEAVYVFPASIRAAVYAMQMRLGERVITAKIKERNKAQEIYKEAKKEGKRVSLLEQQRPNVFQMNVANIMPGDELEVELRYTELLVPTEGVYQFVYPTVVGPRYSNQPDTVTEPTEVWTKNPYLPESKAATYAFDIKVHIESGIPLKDIASNTHQLNFLFQSPTEADVNLKPDEQFAGNRDYILSYKLAGDKIDSGLLLYEGEDENFFLAMLEPPARPSAAEIPPREYIFVVDVSGSMHGFPLNISKLLLKDLIGRLRPTDTFNVILFAGTSAILAPFSLQANNSNINQALSFIEREQGGGGTELLPALEKALSLPRAEGSSRNIIVATDGYVSVEAEAFDLIRRNLGRANLFAFGIGSSVNRHLVEGMSRVGFGESFIVTNPQEAPGKAKKFRDYIDSPVLTNIKVDFGNLEVYDVEPPAIPDVLAARPVVIFGKYRGANKGTITLSGINGEGRYEKTISASSVQPNAANLALRYLWARHKIKLLSDYNGVRQSDERVAQITNLGLTYNLLTLYTSFIAVDEVVARKTGSLKKVKQPLPLPKGVSNLAVGGQIPTVPEPETWALLLVLSTMFFCYLMRKELHKKQQERV